MLNQYPWWKYLLVIVVTLAGLLYAAPNLYGDDPSVQISAKSGVPVDEALVQKVRDTLDGAKISYKTVALEQGRVLARFTDTDTQLKANELIRQEFPAPYISAQNLASAMPDWLRAVGGQPMYLGLDLRGGVHLLIEVDMPAALNKARERYAGDIRADLRDSKVKYLTVRNEGGAIKVKFRDEAERSAARGVIKRKYPALLLEDGADGGEWVLTASLAEVEVREVQKFALEQNITTLRNRVNELGVAEPVIQQQGRDRIVVQLPGVQDSARVRDLLGATATLEFRMVDTSADPVAAKTSGRVPPGSRLYERRGGGPVLLKREVLLTGDLITGAASGVDQQSGSPSVNINLDGKGGQKMSDETKDKVGQVMAVVFIENTVETVEENGQKVKRKKTVEEVINTATIQERLGRRFQIHGLSSTHEARDLALLLRAGALAAPIEIVEERTIGPSLGADNIKTGVQSVVIGFVAIMIGVALYYNLFGLVSCLALMMNLVLTVALMSLIQATLTMPGIAGMLLSVAMAVDANVLINERIREELKNGNSPQASIHAGYDRAFATIADSNITTVVAALLLFAMGAGPVKGFAVTLCLGIATSMFTAITGTRAVVNLIYGGRKVKKLSI